MATVTFVLVLLPPSETKRTGGAGPPLAMSALSFPELDPLRKVLVDELVELARDVTVSRAALGLSPRQDDEIARNAALVSSPTLPALHRYTGVLYDALDAGSLRGAPAARAGARLVVGSALFGLVRATDPVPAYRLSAGSALPDRPTLAARWRPLLDPVLAALAAEEMMVDLRSGSYAALGRVPGAVTVNVLAERADGAGLWSATSTRHTRADWRGRSPSRAPNQRTRRRWRRWRGAPECGCSAREQRSWT